MAGLFGNANGDVWRMPGFTTLYISLAMDTVFAMMWESGELEFRLEDFSLLNRGNLARCNRSAFAGMPDLRQLVRTAGVITNTSGTSRRVSSR